MWSSLTGSPPRWVVCPEWDAKVPFAITSPLLCCGLGIGREGIQQARRVGEELDFVWLGTTSKKKNGKISDIEQKGGRGVESISLFLIY